ncbi:beta-glucosidase [Sphaerisporangium melleum]|uniref:Beta-glucosidase n=1 Tax=Sphaerisporangium melleum TaxID=321316 RepID=A0A917RGX5_9ACTN|nr:glycoside hydrolase family 3 protein [Sphaerisporangium melleum]GGL06001.1 beta-glucosidase [Sphaerisporangium melleum]GII73126.1 beta-glucosidase [Sphaerisporangium melleum]
MSEPSVDAAASVTEEPAAGAALPYFPQWPRVRSAFPRDPGMEERIEGILAQMTLEEKLGQMIQPELAELTAEDARTYKIGSALNGAGIWPGGDRHAGVKSWVETVDAYWEAVEEAWRDRPFRIPFMWATDAVHGHNNVYGATIFPHNIGLGAARDPGLVRRIGAATAREIAATGMDWTFAPTVATPRDRRWGRYYEGYSEDPEVVFAYAREMVTGLQGGAEGLSGDTHVISTIKHWVGDGATFEGVDRGTARCEEDVLRNVHAMGFVSGIEAGAQAVMASFSGWSGPENYDHTPGRPVAYNHKICGSRYLLTDVLKDAMGFDGIVISDWDAHAEVAGCAIGDAGYAINAGLDVLMVAGREAWQSVWRTAREQVLAGVIPMERVDDAVRRVLRVKMRAGLWDKPRPRERSLAGEASVVGHEDHRALAREAVRKSLVLLKNAGGVLPLSPAARVLVAGSGADDIRKQAGGWTLSWQGNDVTLADLPGASTLGMAVAGVTGADGCRVDPYLEDTDPAGYDVAVVAIGEDAYAEMRGTIKPWGTLEYARLKQSYARDLATLHRLRAAGVPVVTVLFTGRPLYVTDEINLSDAFVVAWLPGTEATGITDVLFAGPDGEPAHDFQGRLTFSWPRRKRSMSVNRIPPHIPGYRVPAEEQAPEGEHEPLFPYGFGLSVRDTGPLADPGPLPVDEEPPPPPAPPVSGPLEVHGPRAGGAYRLRIGGHNTWSREDISSERPTETLVVRAEPVGDPARPGAVSLRFNGFVAFVYAQDPDQRPRDLRGYREAGGRLSIEVRVVEAPDAPLYLACHDDYPAQPGLDVTRSLRELPAGTWTTMEVPLEELERIGVDLRHVDVPFMLYTEGRAVLDIGEVRWLTA